MGVGRKVGLGGALARGWCGGVLGGPRGRVGAADHSQIPRLTAASSSFPPEHQFHLSARTERRVEDCPHPGRGREALFSLSTALQHSSEPSGASGWASLWVDHAHGACEGNRRPALLAVTYQPQGTEHSEARASHSSARTLEQLRTA